LVGAGTGSFLVREIAKIMHIPYIDVATLITLNIDKNLSGSSSETRHWASICLPAYAVAHSACHQV